MRDLFVFLHIATGAAWLGAALWTPGDVRRTLGRGRPEVDALAARARPALSLDLAMGIATLVLGLAIVLLDGVNPRTGVQVGLVAVLIRLGVVAFGLRPAWRKIEAAIVAGGELDAAEGPARRMAMFSGIGHALWLVALAGMVF